MIKKQRLVLVKKKRKENGMFREHCQRASEKRGLREKEREQLSALVFLSALSGDFRSLVAAFSFILCFVFRISL